MKFALTHFLLYLLLATHVCAKETPAPSANAQFIENKGQNTDQHGTERRDIDAKIEANGVTMFVGDGEMHYQWVAPPDLPQGEEKDSRLSTRKENGIKNES